MPRQKTVPTKPRFDYVIDQAYKLMVEMGISSLPVSPWDIIKEYSHMIRCIPLSEVRAVTGSDKLSCLLKNKTDEGITAKERGSNLNVIIYDDIRIDNPERILWTIMHELGHVFLRHLDTFENTAMYRGGLSKTEYGVLEVEAHMFAAEVFAPTVIMRRFAGISKEHLRVMCGISDEAAGKRFDSLFGKEYHPATRYDQKMLRNFSGFLRWGAPEAIYKGTQKIIGQASYHNYLKLSRKCKKCLSYTTDSNAKFCIYCGEEFTEPQWDWSGKWPGQDDDDFIAQPGKRHITFEKVSKKQDWEYETLRVCPVCQNEDIKPGAEYCQICGHPLQNICLNEGKAVIIKARHCPDCGGETTFKHGYSLVEAAIERLSLLDVSEEWLEFDYWDYVIGQVRNNRELWTALNCARAFTDDDDMIHIIVGQTRLAAVVENNKANLLLLMSTAAGVNYAGVEVYKI